MESGFNPRATSPTGAQGIAQFEPGTWKSQGIPGSPYDPNAALQGYVKLMGSLLNQYGGNVKNALAAYNAGPGNLPGGMGYANSILSNAGSAGQPSATRLPSVPSGLPALTSVPVTTTSFDQAGFDQANRAFIAGQAVKEAGGAGNPYNATPGATPGFAASLGDTSAPLFAKGLLTSSAPDPQQFMVSTTALQKLAGSTQLTPHPAVTQAMASQNMPKGIVQYGGKPVAAWIAPILQYARAHGWTGGVSSGYRTLAQQTAIYNSGVRPAAVPGTSNHEMTAFPGGAVDVTNASQLSAILAHSPYAQMLVWAGSKDPVHFSHPHNGSY